MEKNIISKRISYLHNLCNLLPSAAQSNLLKTHYLIKSRILQAQSNKVLPAALTKKSSSCPCCCLPHSESGASYKIEPERLSRFTRKVLKKCDRAKPLSRYQQKFVDKLKNCRGNKLVVTCGLCKKEVKIPLTKPTTETESVDETPVVKKRKRKRKDRFSGLDASAVLSATPQKFVVASEVKQQTPIRQQNNTNKKPQLSSPLNKKQKKNKSALSKILNESKQTPKKNTTKLKHFLSSLSF